MQDIRPTADFEAYHIPGSKNVPMFIPIEAGGDVSKMMKQFIYAINGVKGVDENPKFIEQMREIAPPGAPLLVTCDTGGEYMPFGQARMKYHTRKAETYGHFARRAPASS